MGGTGSTGAQAQQEQGVSSGRLGWDRCYERHKVPGREAETSGHAGGGGPGLKGLSLALA